MIPNCILVYDADEKNGSPIFCLCRKWELGFNVDSKIFIHVRIERLRCKQVRNIVHLHQWAHPYNLSNTSWLVIFQKFHLISYRINGTSMTALGFQLHFTDVYLEELAKASEISKTKSEKRYAWNSFIFNRLYTLYKAVYVPGTYRT